MILFTITYIDDGKPNFLTRTLHRGSCIKGCNVLPLLRSISKKISFLVQNGGETAYFRQKCWAISQSKYVGWLLNFIRPSAGCGEIMRCL